MAKMSTSGMNWHDVDADANDGADEELEEHAASDYHMRLAHCSPDAIENTSVQSMTELLRSRTACPPLICPRHSRLDNAAPQP